HAEGTRATAVFFHPSAEAGRQRGGVDQIEIEQLRVDVRDDGGRAYYFTAVEPRADRTVFLDHDFAHRRREADVRPPRRRCFRHRLRDRTHAADRMAPYAAPTVHLAKAMMQQHIGRAGRIRARVITDDAVEPVGGFDRRALEPAVEISAGRIGEEIDE